MNAPAGWQRSSWCVAHLIALLGCMMTWPQAAEAHRLDECLQAARIAVGESRVDIELDLTPGVEVAAQLLAIIDLDRDGRISSLESEAYADLVRASLTLKVDGRRTAMGIELGEFPSPEEMKAGVGIIRLNFSAKVSAFRAGQHRLFFRNRHRTDQSVYLVNALLPFSKRIEVTHQRRDPPQRDFLLEFAVK